MPSKREILELLTRAELQGIADRYELGVDDRRVRERLVEACTGSRKVVLGEVLAAFTRDRLKELCRDAGLGDSGKEKAALVERLLGSGSSPRSNEEPPPTPAPMPPSPSSDSAR